MPHINIYKVLGKIYYTDISECRSELMGWAIIWIMMLHFTFTQIKPLGFVAQYGFAGVELFLFVSGFGIFFALEKSKNALLYYKRRLLRIFPTYYLLGIIASLILKEISPKYSLKKLMLKLKLQFFGHLMRRTVSFEKTLMLGKIAGRRRRG